jgi:phosphoglycolate phosphatase-like HAD superfamily hydrolase
MSNLKDFIIAFDFDGVIWNSVNECLHVGYEVFKGLEGAINIDAETLKIRFAGGRYLVRTGSDFYIVLKLIQEDPSIDFPLVNNDYFYSLRDKYKDSIDKFTHLFYKNRNERKHNNFNQWLSLQGPFPGVIEQLPEIKAKARDLVICTTKDEDSIKKLLAVYKQDYHVYGRDFSTNKKEQMLHLAKSHNLSPENIVFIDDLLENLLQVKNAGVIPVMSGWGYNNRKEWQKAEELGIRIIEKEKILSQIESVIESLAEVPFEGFFRT